MEDSLAPPGRSLSRLLFALQRPLKEEPLPVASLCRVSAQRTLFTLRQHAPVEHARPLSEAWLQALQLAQIASDRCAGFYDVYNLYT